MKKIRIKYIYRCIPFQVIIIIIFGFGAILGIVNDEGILFAYTGDVVSTKYILVCCVYFYIFVLMLIISKFVRPIKTRKFLVINKGVSQIIVSIILIVIGCILLGYNLIRLQVFELIATNPGLIAYKIIEERGAVIYISTMSVFFIGAAGLLDQLSAKYLKIIVFILIFFFSCGLLLITRREQVFIALAWLSFLIYQQKGFRYMLIIFGPIILIFMYVFMMFRNIDILSSPLKYASTGEFEPFRLSLLLGYKWIGNYQYISPLEYVIPFLSDGPVIRDVNGYFTEAVFNLPFDSNLGLPTVSIFTTFLYFGGILPVIFYGIHLFLIKQCAFMYEHSASYMYSYLYVFSLIKLLLMIRNGQLFSGLIDSIVLFFIFGIYYSLTKIKYS